MAIWRDRYLEVVLQGPLDSSGLTEDAISTLVTDAVAEGEQLDFKIKPHLPETGSIAGASPSADPPCSTCKKEADRPRHDWKPEQEWAKDVCQFANHRGGLLIIGIKEDNDVAVEVKATVKNPAALEHRLRVALSNFASPAPRVDFVAIPAATGDYYMAVVVPPSELSPHAVTDGLGGGRKPLHFPIRNGADVRWMQEAEVSERYRRRMQVQADHEASMAEVVGNAAEQLRLAAGLWLYVATKPESLAGPRLDRSMVARIKGWHQSHHFVSPLERGLFLPWGAFPAPGRVTFTGQAVQPDDEATDPRGGFVELYADGRAFAASPITFNTGADEGSGNVGIMTLVDDSTILLDLVLSWSVEQAGAWGNVDIQAGLVHEGDLDSDFDPPLSLHVASGDELHRLANTRLVRRPVRSLVTADLGTCLTTQGRLAVVHDVASAILQHFGQADTGMIEPDGSLIGFQWGSTYRRMVQSWAADHDVAYSDHPL